jgi:hypothetical protein
MELFAQIGYGEGTKTNEGLLENTISGMIFSPKDLSKNGITEKAKELKGKYPDAQILFDPQLYAWVNNSCIRPKDGEIASWDYPRQIPPHTGILIRDVQAVVTAYINEMLNFSQLSGIITPNIYVSGSLTQPEALEFIEQAQKIAQESGETRPIYPSIVLDNCVLLSASKTEVDGFLNTLKELRHRPAGFYLLVSTNNSSYPVDLFKSKTISTWMYINHVLSTSGYSVINGYSDILSPFLQFAGGYAGATGWWGNLHFFSMDRFCDVGTGHQHRPSPRYLSIALLNRIVCSEYSRLSAQGILVKNQLPHDADYDRMAKVPQKIEILQTWETIAELLRTVTTLQQLKDIIGDAKQCYGICRSSSVRWFETSQDFHLDELEQSIDKYNELIATP